MSLRASGPGFADAIHRRLDEVLESEDAVIVLADRRGTTTHVCGHGLSGCQLEMLARIIDDLFRPGPATPGRSAGADPCVPSVW